MDLVAISFAVLRRWYVLIFFLALGALGAHQTITTTERFYEVQGTYLMSTLPSLGERQEPPPGEAGDAQGVDDAVLLVAVLNLDPRFRDAPEASGPRFTATPISSQTVRLAVLAESPQQAEQLLDEVIVLAEQAVKQGVELDIVARSDASAAADGDDYQAGGLLRLSGAALEGGPQQVPANYAGRILGELMLSSETRAEILRDGVAGSYNLTRDDRDQAPILVIEAVATAPEVAVTIFERTLSAAAERLDRIQDAEDVGETNRLNLVPLVEPTAPIVGDDPARRPALTIFGLSGLVGVGVALLLDQLTAVRAQRRRNTPRRGGHIIHPRRRATDEGVRAMETSGSEEFPPLHDGTGERESTSPR